MMYDEETLRSAIQEAGGFQPAARLLRERGFNISDRTLRRYFGNRTEEQMPEFEREDEPMKAVDIEELITRRIKQFARKKEIYQKESIIPVKVNIDGPIGIGFTGDMHLDDDGTDLAEAIDHVDLFDGRQKGLFAVNQGDSFNNWSGRLARLYSEQSTSSAEAIALIEEILPRVNWLYYLNGNHDLWSQGGDLLRHILAGAATVHKSTKTRIGLKFPNGRQLKIYSVHGFSGKSMWSEVYGAAKKAQMDGEHHDIYVAGHIHTSGYTHGMRPSSGEMWHALQVASYKKIDRYAEELNLDSKDLYNCPVALIDPYATSPVNYIRFEFDPHEGAERLTWMQKRFQQRKSSS